MILITLFVIGLLLGAAAVIFALQNVAVITVTFFSWQITGSLALILSLAISTGFLIALLLFLPESVSNYFRYRTLLRDNKKLEDELEKQKQLTVFAKHTPPTEEEIAKIEHGATTDAPIE